MNRHLITAIASLLALSLSSPAPAADDTKSQRIKKCQDAAGKWHYGDTADAECARSKVIELDKQGVKRKEIAPPLTESELKARELNQSEEVQRQRQAEEQKRRDQQLLATYAIEDDLILSRDRKLGDLDKQVRGSQETVQSLKKTLARIQAQAQDEKRGGKEVSAQTAKTLASSESQIQRHEEALARLQKEQENTRAQFESDLRRFRELKNKQSATPAKR